MILKIKKIIFSIKLLLVVFMTLFVHSLFAKKTPQNRGDTIEFSGYKWVTKDSYEKRTGPGNNYFSGSKENVFVDKEGRLHLRLTYRNDNWYCPEVQAVQSLGYGRYHFYLEALSVPLDKDIVIGLFIYDRDDTTNYHKEVDIEFSYWGKEKNKNTQYVVQPHEDQAYRFDTDLSKQTYHVIDISKRKMCFESGFVNSLNPDSTQKRIASAKKKPKYVFLSDDEKVNINVWLFHTTEPSDLKEVEIVIAKFEFEELKAHRFLNLFSRKKVR